jgi:hypothetical protein
MPFLNLSRELRDEVYKYLIPSQLHFAPRITPKTSNRKQPSTYFLLKHPLMLLNRQIRSEALEILFSTTTFLFNANILAGRTVRLLQSLPSTEVVRMKRIGWTFDALERFCKLEDISMLAQYYKGWATPIEHIAIHFQSLKTITFCVPADGIRRGRVSAKTMASRLICTFFWSVPRLATTLLMGGRIDELRLSYTVRISETLEVEKLAAILLLRVPVYEDVDAGMEQHIWWMLVDEIDRDSTRADWAAGCLFRPKHAFVVQRLPDCALETTERTAFVLTRK